ncbi:hypothetical protein [Actinomycetospora soli]|uniref:hypothetical protein n=1 Tax=Actinomycetospora soli TaxID=2893887 RepID=UPI001E3D208B|nr:hypothetical protein [Actinomycetospora soli]MCD2188447.1 hypothetical protein [Actinomycetospora soli]
MAQQGTEEQTSSEQSSSEEASGRHRAPDEGATDRESTDQESTETSSEKSTETSSESSSGEKPSDATTEKQSAPADAKTEKQSAPADAKTEKQSAPADARTEKHERGAADTSWAEPESSQRRHVDVGEIVWRAGNVVATVLRTLALLFALVLIVNLVLVLVGVNPANGVAQFIGGLANLVILGFRDLFVPADPTIALIVNSLVAAVFWVFVGELLSRLIRFLAARVK